YTPPGWNVAAMANWPAAAPPWLRRLTVAVNGWFGTGCGGCRATFSITMSGSLGAEVAACVGVGGTGTNWTVVRSPVIVTYWTLTQPTPPFGSCTEIHV